MLNWTLVMPSDSTRTASRPSPAAINLLLINSGGIPVTHALNPCSHDDAAGANSRMCLVYSHIINVVQLRRERVGRGHRDDLPVELAVVDHREDAERLHRRDRARF